MFRLKLIKKPILFKLKTNFSFPPIVLANMQEKEVIPTTYQQIVTPDKNYDGLSKVIVDKIPDEYIIPTGNIEITKNGIYNVREKETANVNIPVLKLGTKNITENGVYKASDDELDGYSEVTVGIKPLFTGSYDRQGLKQIGWTDEEIDYYNQNGVQWNASENEYFKLTQTELAGDNSENTRFIPKNSTRKNFEGYYKLLAIPQLNTSNVTSMQYMFNRCYSLTTIPQLNTSNVTTTANMFNSCYSLTTIPQLDTSKVTNMHSMFSSCYSLTTIPLLDISNVTDTQYMFYDCYSLKTIPQLDTSKVTNINSMFNSCSSLTTIPQLNTSNVTTMQFMFNRCYSLTTIPQLDTSKVTYMNNFVYDCGTLKDFGGLENLGQAYLTTQSANYSSYKLDLSTCTALTEQSLINVLTNLYDIKTKGCQSQKVVLGSTNLAKLKSEEGQQALAQAQQFGWNIS